MRALWGLALYVMATIVAVFYAFDPTSKNGTALIVALLLVILHDLHEVKSRA